MGVPGYWQVTWARLLIAAASLPTLAACGGNCDARLTLINASGLAIAFGTLRPSGAREAPRMKTVVREILKKVF